MVYARAATTSRYRRRGRSAESRQLDASATESSGAVPIQGRVRRTSSAGNGIESAFVGDTALMPVQLGAFVRGEATVELTVWAPHVQSIEVHTAGGVYPLVCGDGGLHGGRFPGEDRDEYLLALDGKETYSDPCSRSQPHGVRGRSQ